MNTNYIYSNKQFGNISCGKEKLLKIVFRYCHYLNAISNFNAWMCHIAYKYFHERPNREKRLREMDTRTYLNS